MWINTKNNQNMFNFLWIKYLLKELKLLIQFKKNQKSQKEFLKYWYFNQRHKNKIEGDFRRKINKIKAKFF